MAQLSDDCFALGGALLSVEAAAALIAARVPPLRGEESRAAARRARPGPGARTCRPRRPLPPFPNSAVDGYAFRHADLRPGGAQPARPRRAASPPARRRRTRCRPAPPPASSPARRCRAGADTVLMQEDAAAAAAAALVAARPEARRQCPPGRARMWPRAPSPCPAGRRLRAPEIGLAAALGLRRAAGARRGLRVGVFSTGDELAAPGEPLGPAQTYDSNRFTLLALLARLPVEATDLGILPDGAAATAAALRGAGRRARPAADLRRRLHRGGGPCPRRHRGRAGGWSSGGWR